jgi:3'-5' exonuclease
MRRIVFDIETVGADLSALDELSQEYFLRYADTPEKIKEAKDALSFYPLTAQVVAVGMLEVESEKGAVYYQNGEKYSGNIREGDILFISGNEEEILQHFWQQMKRYDQFVTFNGRGFDCPFLMLRSAIHGIRATRNLMPYRYSANEHIDLLDQLTFYDALRRRFSLHMWCQAFGIPSPKEGGMTGLRVKQLYEERKYLDIARYCYNDVLATKTLFRNWERNLKF